MRFVLESMRRWTGGLGIIVAACAPPFGFDLGHMTASVSGGPQANFVADHRGARKVPGIAPAPADHPGEVGLDRRGQLVDVIAVEAQARFEPVISEMWRILQ